MFGMVGMVSWFWSLLRAVRPSPREVLLFSVLGAFWMPAVFAAAYQSAGEGPGWGAFSGGGGVDEREGMLRQLDYSRIMPSDAGVDCDQILRNQLVFKRGASTAANMNVVISQIQDQRDTCTSETWDPEVDDTLQPAGAAGSCWGFSGPAAWDAPEVGGVSVPQSLRGGEGWAVPVRSTSGRDSENNIIVYFGNELRRPHDGAVCWLYVNAVRLWGENY